MRTEACPTNALVFGDYNDDKSRVSIMRNDDRKYTHLDALNTDPNVVYLAQVDATGGAAGGHE